jgi:hypothetical protein
MARAKQADAGNRHRPALSSPSRARAGGNSGRPRFPVVSYAEVMDAEVVNTPEIDKSTWGDGPWQDEPDRVDFIAEGFACMAIRNRFGVWCGYVGVPSDHPAYGQDYGSIDAEVHGGLTYAARCSGNICHVPQPGMPHDVWWLGFDCGHGMDIAPAMRANSIYWGLGYCDFGELYRDLNYVRAEILSLARQLK